MKIRKILAAVAAAAVAVSTMAVNAFAAETVSCKLYSQNTESWTLYESDAFDISSDGGDYNVTLNAGGENLYITLYIKDVTGGAAAEAFNGGTVTINSIKANGKTLTPTKTEYELVNPDSGVIDVCMINGWAETFVESGDCSMSEEGDSYSFGGPVDTFEVDFSVSFGDAAPEATTDTAETTDAPATGNAPAAAMAAVMALAGAAAIAAKKSK
ncbi:MAG: hypothetical protein J6K17_04420 [Oscillospiraceae bacterium]|nr:hypothetical protein [Oscillospiraceae bacterium]